MKINLWLAAATFAAICAGQDLSKIAPIKGHMVGETIDEYLSKITGGAEFIQACRQAVTKQIAKKLKLPPAMYSAVCQSLLQGANGQRIKLSLDNVIGPTTSLEQRMLSFFDWAFTGSCLGCPPFGGPSFDYSIFEDGKVVYMDLDIGLGEKLLKTNPTLSLTSEILNALPILTYDDVMRDMISRFGKPTSTDVLRTRNGFGATFEYRMGDWRLPDISIHVQETDASIQTPVTNVTIITNEAQARWQAARPQNDVLK